MSQWTHVNGSIRIDALRLPGMPQIDLKELFKTANYEDDEKSYEESNVPKGSEGSLDVSIWENPSPNAIASYTVNFFGDLRDYDDEEEIHKWFKKIVEESELIIRDAVMTVDIEYKSYSVYAVDDESKVIKVFEKKK